MVVAYCMPLLHGPCARTKAPLRFRCLALKALEANISMCRLLRWAGCATPIKSRPHPAPVLSGHLAMAADRDSACGLALLRFTPSYRDIEEWADCCGASRMLCADPKLSRLRD
jgi:hypothetical protein